jgi:hypothetical protein
LNGPSFHANRGIGKIISQPALKERLVAQGVDLAPPQPPSSFTSLLREDLAKWPAIIKASGAMVD